MDPETDIFKGRREPAFSFSAISESLTNDELLRCATRVARDRNVSLYLTGGMLRDILLGSAQGAGKGPGDGLAQDYDLSVGSLAKGFALALAGKIGGTFFALDKEREVFRVVCAAAQTTIDISPVRRGSIKRDLELRDFTVNAFAVDLPALFDAKRTSSDLSTVFFATKRALEDTRARTLRVVNKGVFDDDPLRLLRAFRIAQTCSLEIEESTRTLIKQKPGLLAKSAKERVMAELVLIFAARGTAPTLSALFETGLMDVVMPEFHRWSEMSGYDLLSHTLKVVEEAEGVLTDLIVTSRPELRAYLAHSTGGVSNAALLKLAAFLHDAGKALVLKRGENGLSFRGHEVESEKISVAVLKRIRFGRRAIKLVATLVRNHHRAFNLARIERPGRKTKAHFFRAVGGRSGKVGLLALLLALADVRATIGRDDPVVTDCVKRMLEFYYDEYSKKYPPPLFTGAEVMEFFNVSQGPVVGLILDKVGKLVEAGDVQTADEAIRRVRATFEARDDT